MANLLILFFLKNKFNFENMNKIISYSFHWSFMIASVANESAPSLHSFSSSIQSYSFMPVIVTCVFGMIKSCCTCTSLDNFRGNKNFKNIKYISRSTPLRQDLYDIVHYPICTSQNRFDPLLLRRGGNKEQ